MDVLAPKIKPELVRELARLAEKPEDLFGPTGLLQEIKKSLVEQLLEVEMDSHLGYDKGVDIHDGQSCGDGQGVAGLQLRGEGREATRQKGSS